MRLVSLLTIGLAVVAILDASLMAGKPSTSARSAVAACARTAAASTAGSGIASTAARAALLLGDAAAGTASAATVRFDVDWSGGEGEGD